MNRTPVARQSVPALRTAWLVLRKEVVDALRDRRTLMMVLMSSVLMGPLMLFMLSIMVGNMEAKAERRELYVSGIDQAPTLRNYLERQSLTIKQPPGDFEAQLKNGKLRDAVVVVAPGFEADLQQGEPPRVEIVFDSSSREAANGEAAHRALDGFMRERATLALVMRGVAPELMRGLSVSERDLANTQARAVQITGIVPLFVLMAVVIGALNAALDTTAGERERGSLEPLLMTPGERWALVMGKWGAVTSLGVLVAALSCLSFLPAQALLRSDNLQALFQFGAPEVIRFMLVLAPFAAAVSAAMMMVALNGKTIKEAQARCSALLMIINLVPLVVMLNPGGEEPWYFAVPVLSQNLMLTHVLKGEGLTPLQMALSTAVSLTIALLCVWQVGRKLREAAVR